MAGGRGTWDDGQIVIAVDPGKTTGLCVGLLPDDRGPGFRRAVRAAQQIEGGCGLEGMRGVRGSGLVGMQVTGGPEEQARKIANVIGRVGSRQDALTAGLARSRWPIVICIERFVLYAGNRLRSSTGEGGRGGGGQLVAVEVAWCLIGRLEALGVPFAVRWENAAAAMTTIKDDALRGESLWWKGLEHARDAARHWALYGQKFTMADEARAWVR